MQRETQPSPPPGGLSSQSQERLLWNLPEPTWSTRRTHPALARGRAQSALASVTSASGVHFTPVQQLSSVWGGSSGCAGPPSRLSGHSPEVRVQSHEPQSLSLRKVAVSQAGATSAQPTAAEHRFLGTRPCPDRGQHTGKSTCVQRTASERDPNTWRAKVPCATYTPSSPYPFAPHWQLKAPRKLCEVSRRGPGAMACPHAWHSSLAGVTVGSVVPGSWHSDVGAKVRHSGSGESEAVGGGRGHGESLWGPASCSQPSL